VGELSPEVQGQVLRAIEQRRFARMGGTQQITFHGRFVFATNRDLAAEVQAGRFREDLYYRISVIECRLPPLRERADEVDALIHAFVRDIAPRLGRAVPTVAPAALARVRNYAWPGNVRELRNRVERALALSEATILTAADLFPEEAAATQDDSPPAQANQDRLADARAAAEAAHISRVLEETGRNMQRTARRLGISRTTLWEKMRNYDL